MRLLLRISIILVLAVASCRLLLAQDADGVYSKVDENPTPLKTRQPKYPESLRRDGVSGVVSVTCVIDETGNVISSSAAKSTHADFEKPALEAINAWKFKPAKIDGKPVKVRVKIPFRFDLND